MCLLVKQQGMLREEGYVQASSFKRYRSMSHLLSVSNHCKRYTVWYPEMKNPSMQCDAVRCDVMRHDATQCKSSCNA